MLGKLTLSRIVTEAFLARFSNRISPRTPQRVHKRVSASCVVCREWDRVTNSTAVVSVATPVSHGSHGILTCTSLHSTGNGQIRIPSANPSITPAPRRNSLFRKSCFHTIAVALSIVIHSKTTAQRSIHFGVQFSFILSFETSQLSPFPYLVSFVSPTS